VSGGTSRRSSSRGVATWAEQGEASTRKHKPSSAYLEDLIADCRLQIADLQTDDGKWNNSFFNLQSALI
jgi:hypothetical protein